ncbi:MAG: hypothetical protein AAF806_21880 [Bacteroidota bacterium]
MRQSLLIALFLAAFLSTNAQNTALKNYQENSIYIRQGLFSNVYVKEGQTYPRGFMDSKLKQELEISPNAIIEFKKYRRNQWIAGGIALVGSILYTSSFSDDEFQAVPFSIGLGSFVTSAFISLHSFNKLDKAVWHYNQDILR